MRDICFSRTAWLWPATGRSTWPTRTTTTSNSSPPGGEFLNAWGSAGSDAGQFDRPSGIAVAGDGTVYVVDTGNHRIQLFTPDGEFIAWWGRED